MKFNPTAFITGATYEVQGSMEPQRSVSSNPTLPMFSQATSPYGTYPTSRCQDSSPMPQPLPLMSDESLTILLGKRAQHDVNKSSISCASRLTHTIITSVIVTLDHSMGECNIAFVEEMVKHEVGFSIILLDSKLIDSEATSWLEYWKSTRKIIAASWSIYERLVGKSPAEEISQLDEDVVVVDQPAKRIKLTTDGDDSSILTKLEEIEKTVSEINEKLLFWVN